LAPQIRGVPFKCLPLDFMGIYALVGLEEDKKIKDMTKQFILQVGV
jgi:sister-chromatid-cohesion protein PDS5